MNWRRYRWGLLAAFWIVVVIIAMRRQHVTLDQLLPWFFGL